MSLRIYNLGKRLFKNNQFILNVNLKLSANFCQSILPYEEIPVAKPYVTKPSSFFQYVEETHKDLGPIFIAKLQIGDVVCIADPEANIKMFEAEGKYPKHLMFESWISYLKDNGKKRGLLFAEGEEWYKNRSSLNKVMLRPNAMENHVQNVSSVCKNLMEIWKINPPSDFIYPLYCWTSECVGAVLLGKNLGLLETLKCNKTNLQDKDEAFVKSLLELFETTIQLAELDPSLAKSSKTLSWMTFNKAANTAFSYGESIIQKSIQDCTDKFSSENIRESVVCNVLNEQKLEVENIKNVVIDLILTSVDTASYTALWALYLLGRNPEIANKAREEIFSVLKSENTLSLKTINRIKCLRGIIKETLRLYPSVGAMIRVTGHDAELCNYHVPAGTVVSSSLTIMGRDPNNFTFPDEFRPDRWLSKLEKPVIYTSHSNKASTPFAFGKRTCIGRRVVDLSLSLLLIEALTTFKWTVENEVDVIMTLVTAPSKNIKMKFNLL